MCVITICMNKRETEENLKAMEEANKDGTGVIFYKDGMPHYRKNIAIGEVLEINGKMEFPFAFHFRFATVGHDKMLTHPFEVDEESKLKIEGSAPTLLMHNGHWNSWDDTLNRYCINTLEDLPDGDWSDSRAMAFIAAKIGPNILKTISGQKVALFKEGPKIITIGSGWEKGDGILYSNKNWEYKKHKTLCQGSTEYPDWWKENQHYFKGKDSRERREQWPSKEEKEVLRKLQVGAEKAETEGGK